MSPSDEIRVRRSVHELQNAYDRGDKKPLEDLVRAWRGIQQLPFADKRSFFAIAGYHGEPFQYRPQVDSLSAVDGYAYWGGYCNHGNVLFPTWHRVYVFKLEEALRSIVPDVTLPYWDETSAESLGAGIPAILTQPTFELDGELIRNPLQSFTLPDALSDNLAGDEQIWQKPAGYTTVRYPLSGLVGTAEARAATAAHNAQYPDLAQNVTLLNQNIIAWLNGPEPTKLDTGANSVAVWEHQNGTYGEFLSCLHAPNYTVFSNTSSAGLWNQEHSDSAPLVIPLESPHNHLHLAVGGFDVPGQGEAGVIAGANGDMGENNTAAMDPIFFFHHCNIDRVFWLWQKRNGFTDHLAIIDHYYGTNSSDSQGPTPGIAPGTPLSLDTPLNPFVKDEFGNVYTSRECINIEKQLGYTYAAGSLEEIPTDLAPRVTRNLMIKGLDRAVFQGSFVLSAYALVQGNGTEEAHFLGRHSVLSRRNLIKCANCLTHLEVVAHFPIPDAITPTAYRIDIQHRGPEIPAKLRVLGQVQQQPLISMIRGSSIFFYPSLIV